MAKNSEKVAIRVERRTYISPDILRLKPENKGTLFMNKAWILGVPDPDFGPFRGGAEPGF